MSHEKLKDLSLKDRARFAGNELDRIFRLMGGEQKVPKEKRIKITGNVIERCGLDTDEGAEALLADTDERLAHADHELKRANKEVREARIRYIQAIIRSVFRL